jgi:hypothetical protein
MIAERAGSHYWADNPFEEFEMLATVMFMDMDII